MAKKELLTLDTEFPRSWRDIGPDGESLHCVTQPYITGLYLAINSGNSLVAQLSVSYNKLSKFVKELQGSTTVKDLYLGKVGQYLNEDDLKIVNS